VRHEESTTTETRPDTPEAAGEVRQRLRRAGWQSDFAWIEVGAGTAPAAVHAAGEEEARRTIAYLASLRSVDQGAARVWREGDVPAPHEADAREVMVAGPDVADWHSEVFEAPAETVEHVETDDEAVPAEQVA
jgi:hypothetical protein